MLLGILVITLVFTMAAVGCDDGSKDDDGGGNLNGTTWKRTEDGSTGVLTFNSPNFTWKYTHYDGNTQNLKGTYAVSGSTVTLKFDNGNQDVGTLSGNQLTFNGMVFTKQ